MQAHRYQTDETTALIRTFPEDFADSRTLEDDREAAWVQHAAQEMEDEWRSEQYIARNFDECGNRFGELFDPFEDHMERMAEAYDPGLNHI